jgi:hypothetical protein
VKVSSEYPSDTILLYTNAKKYYRNINILSILFQTKSPRADLNDGYIFVEQDESS